MLTLERIAIFRHHGSKRIPAQAGRGADVLLEKLLKCFQRCEFVAVLASMPPPALAGLPIAAVDCSGFGVAGWTGHGKIKAVELFPF